MESGKQITEVIGLANQERIRTFGLKKKLLVLRTNRKGHHETTNNL